MILRSSAWVLRDWRPLSTERRRLENLVLDRIGPGGQAGASSKIENYVGFPTGLFGADLVNRAVTQAENFGAISVSASHGRSATQ